MNVRMMVDMMNKTRRARNRRNGQYTYEGGFDRLCRCGRRFGEHMAEAPHDLDDEQTSCPRFRPAPAPRAGRAKLEELASRTAGHGEMCPCDACREVRAL